MVTAEQSRVYDADGSVRPSRDTGFRVTAAPAPPYVRPQSTTPKIPFNIAYLHNDDLTDVGQGTLRGQPLDGVRVYEINYESAEKRLVGEIRSSVMRSQGMTPCLCDLPGSVPCADCGAGC